MVSATHTQNVRKTNRTRLKNNIGRRLGRRDVPHAPWLDEGARGVDETPNDLPDARHESGGGNRHGAVDTDGGPHQSADHPTGGPRFAGAGFARHVRAQDEDPARPHRARQHESNSARDAVQQMSRTVPIEDLVHLLQRLLLLFLARARVRRTAARRHDDSK
jgi:hypothetical protein